MKRQGSDLTTLYRATGQASARMSRSATLVLLVVALLAGYTPAHAAAPEQSTPTAQYTVGDCRNIDKDQVRAEIERHALEVISGATVPLDIDQLVERKWVELRMDAVIAAAVARASADLYSREDYFNRLASGWWSDKAQEYAEEIANAAFGSPEFRAKVEELSIAIGAEVARQVETQFAQAASVALLCLKEYVGEQYAQTLFTAFERSVQVETEQLNLTTSNVPEINAIASHQLALAGVGTILVTQLVYRLAQKLSEKIAQRVAGKIVGRILGRVGSSFIPVAGWIIGIGMIVYDLWEGGQGALPQIEEALTSPEVSAKIREEIATAIKDDLPDQTAWIALETSVSLVEQWQQFCSRYQDICATADSNADYGSLLEVVTLGELERLDELTAYLLNQAGRATLDIVVADGRLEQLLAMPDSTVRELLAWSQPAALLAWQGMAGAQLPRLVEYGVHRQSAPEEFTPATLAALLALPGSMEADKLLALAPEKRDVLLELPQDVLDQLAAAEPVADLDWLAGYLLFSQDPPAQVAVEVAAGRTSVDALRTPAQFVAPAAGPAGTETDLARVMSGTAAPSGGLQAATENDRIGDLGILALLAVLLLAAGAGGYWFWRRAKGVDRDLDDPAG